MDCYLDSRQRNILEQSTILFRSRWALNNVISNVNTHGQDTTLNYVMRQIEMDIIRNEHKISQSMLQLKRMRSTLKGNKTNFFEALRFVVCCAIFASIIIGGSVYRFIDDIVNKMRRDEVITYYTGGFILIVLQILLMLTFISCKLKW